MVQKVKALGKKEEKFDLMNEHIELTINNINDKSKEKLTPHIDKIYKVLEEAAPTTAAKESIQEVSKIINIEKSLKGLLKNEELKLMGSDNHDKMSSMIKDTQDKLSKSKTTKEKSEILVKDLNKMSEFVKDIEKQSGKGKFKRVKKVISSGLLVAVTIGLNKSAKQKLAAAKFIMNSNEETRSRINDTSNKLVTNVGKLASQIKPKEKGASRG